MSFSDQLETPFQLVLEDIVRQKYIELCENIPFAKIYYAVKANPASEIITLLNTLGSNFDVASVYELRKLLSLGVKAERLSCGNTIKKTADIKEFYDAGIRLFVTDSESDLRNIAKAAPGSKIFVRLLTEGLMTADWPLSRKFGCNPDMAYDLLVLAKKLDLDPYGISFHVGSQQRDIAAWDNAIAKVKYLFDWVTEEDIKLKCINMGGGFPAHYIEKTNSIDVYAKEITRYLQEDFGDDLPEIIVEPGRSLVADAGVLVTETVLIARKSRTALERWVYTDVGKFNGMMETLNESIKYPLYTTKKGLAEKCILAGPTCDSVDTLYEDYQYELPLNLAIGDRLYWLSTGAYTSSYSAVEFNGFPPLKTYVI
ncbi:MAG: type III PLP-dependent enzyme [Victivallaceae bacterium]|nr:type III PLP-dependent enzyme [Victivallaceae bacterium]MDD4181878.1 type III PLP-dependent enzyme [Victivallaceae bacterium]